MRFKHILFSAIAFLLTLAVAGVLGCSFKPLRLSPPVSQDICISCPRCTPAHTPLVSLTTDPEPSGVVILVHGLNNPAEVMSEISKLLTAHSFHTVTVTLSGHRKDLTEQLSLTAEDWVRDIYESYCFTKERFPTLQISAIGYSLGGLTLTTFIDRYQRADFKRLILFAPAIKLRRYAYLLSPFLLLRHFNVWLPSLAPRNYRLHNRTSTQVYYQLFRLVNSIATPTNPERLNSIPTRIYISKHDEVVDPAGISYWLKENMLDNWQIEYIKTDKSRTVHHNHFIIVANGTGYKTWQRLKTDMLAFLKD
ncbi:MAG: alpha/beta fold hydrolase [Candidatus Dadabacteria bacterium]|nr:MAG: alpha/beta fold hydrolase [Candidatus Dadabacteria bacterium]